MTDQERAESVIRAGVPVDARDFTCAGCGETVTIRVPGRPAGGHGTLVTVDDKDIAGKPVDIFVHRNRKCITAGVVKALGESAGDTAGTEPEAEAEIPPVAHLPRGRRSDATPAPEPQSETAGR